MANLRARRIEARRTALTAALCVAALVAGGCRGRRPAEQKFSAVTVLAEPAAPIVVRIPGAEYDVWPSGYVQAYQIQARTAHRFSIEEPEPDPTSWGDKLWVNGKEVTDFSYDFKSLKTVDAKSRIGSLGKHVELKARSRTWQIEKTLSLEVYDDFPNLAIEQLTYLNLGNSDLVIDRVQAQRHRLDASISDVKAERYALWSFHGSSIDAGHDDVFQIPRDFSQRNLMAAPVAVKGERGSVGGGIPFVALWTATLGLAIGQIEPLPQVVAFPVHTMPDRDVETYMEIEPGVRLKSHEQYTTPRSFVATYTGDFYEPLHLYAQVLGRETAPPLKPSASAYAVGWSAAADPGVTPAQITATIPALKAMSIKSFTLEGRWFDAYGDWAARGDSLSEDAIRNLAAQFRKQNLLTSIAWTPLAVEDAEAGRKGAGSRVAREHPEWLVLDKSGRHARTTHNLAALCPAVPEVRAYIKTLVVRFLRDWGLDGMRLDDAYTVPECFNPAHHHESPQDSLRAMGPLYKDILESAKALRPDGAIEISPWGTTPNYALLPYERRASIAGAASSAQARRRIKMYKALLGPQAAVAGDAIDPGRPASSAAREDMGDEFAAVVGTGGIPGAGFPIASGAQPGPKFASPEKEAAFRKWMKIANDLALPQGNFQNLYVTGYDDPEGFAVQQNGKTYFAFFTPDPGKSWKGEVELRGIGRGRFRVYDYAAGKELGTVTSPRLRIAVQFTGYLLLEVSLQQ